MSMTRESWLNDLVSAVRPLFSGIVEVPDSVGISVGFPKSVRGRGSNRAIGQCWPRAASDWNRPEIFIHPSLVDPVEIAGVVVHELIHAAGVQKHGRPFAAIAATVGLREPWTATTPGTELTASLRAITARLNPYPHGRLNEPSHVTNPGSRLLKVSCASCGYTVRITRKWLDVGPPLCGVDGSDLIEG
jgi:hypothetical protein